MAQAFWGMRADRRTEGKEPTAASQPKTNGLEIEQRVIALRQQYPDWGAGKLVELLKREQVQLPRITAHRILLRNGLVREQDRHTTATKRFEREAPNQPMADGFQRMPENKRPGVCRWWCR